MSVSFASFVARLFSAEDRSDCSVVFYCASTEQHASACGGEDEPAGKRQKIAAEGQDTQPASTAAGGEAIGDPLPAHSLVICGGSPRFRAQFDRWIQEKGPGSKPVLRVPIGAADELPHALSALRFIYTGSLDVSSAVALLRVRRMAAYLQVEGCVEACDSALMALVAIGTATQPESGALAGVAELYGSRHLLPDLVEEPKAVQRLLDACRQQLVQHSGAAGSKGAVSEGGPSLGELLAWAFCDAPSLMSNLKMRKQMEALPASAMEALLGSDSFATDDEATVLLVLARWLESNPATPDATCKQLRKLIRLSQLSSTYLHVVLPAIPWFPISAEEQRFLCNYVAATDAQRLTIASVAKGKYDCSSAWYASAARPAPLSNAGREYDWFINQKELEAMSANDGVCRFPCKFVSGVMPVSYGFEWSPGVQRRPTADAAGVFLYCNLSAVLRLPPSMHVLAAVNPGPVLLVAYKWREDGRWEGAWKWTIPASTYFAVGGGLGYTAALPLKAAPAGGKQEGQGAATTTPDPLAPWAPYLHDGKIRGTMRWD